MFTCVPVALLPNVDLTQRIQCGEAHCPVTLILAAMVVWSFWSEEKQRWSYTAFCSQEHALAQMPNGCLNKA